MGLNPHNSAASRSDQGSRIYRSCELGGPGMLGLQRLLRRVRLVNRLEVERSFLTDGLQNSGTFVGRNLLVAVIVDYESRYVLDDASDGGDVTLTVFEDNSNLRACDV